MGRRLGSYSLDCLAATHIHTYTGTCWLYTSTAKPGRWLGNQRLRGPLNQKHLGRS